MRTISQTLFAAMLSIGLASSAVQAAPGDAQEEPRLMLLSSSKAPCAVRKGLCMTAGAASTRPVASLLAGGSGAPIANGGESSLFHRVISDSASKSYDEDSVPWTLDVTAAFQKNALAGNALFILTDTQDPEQATAAHVVTALFQTPIASGDGATVRLVLHPEDGFRGGHTYRLRVVQLVAGKEVELVAGEIGLL